ncbi:hypothetical protein SAMN02910357_00082 [Succinivibrio dextrinosolvens]|uniref:hypothetical protein n=1 Tax=Succinivibrio dextrinosolvens TaxID=83771 RepID=UPI0008E0E586|nr:hypothetical protein [Succinivibrio dextrinosolvens]SFS31945.1 hypothetical protein SAMN02910357_00082 [Succinivibrio dextrinosolvens]
MERLHLKIIVGAILISSLSTYLAYSDIFKGLRLYRTTAVQQQTTVKPQPFMSIPKAVRLEAAKELQENLMGAKLNEENRRALNAQINEVGLYINDNSDIELLKDDYHDVYTNPNQGRIFKDYAFSKIHGADEEEEEEEIVSTNRLTTRVSYRKRLLMQYILGQLQHSLKTDSRYKGRRVGGSEYIQEQLRKYGK